MVSFSSKFEYCATKQIKLNCHLGSHGWIYDAGKFMGCKDSEWVVPEVQDRDEAIVTNSLKKKEEKKKTTSKSIIKSPFHIHLKLMCAM